MARKKIGMGRSGAAAGHRRSRVAPHQVKAFVDSLVLRRPFCTICKRFQRPDEEINGMVYENDDSDDDIANPPAHNRSKLGTRWVSTQELTPVTHSPLHFKLFELLEIEFNIGNICNDCNNLVEQMDSVQVNINRLKDKLTQQVDKHFNKNLTYELNPEPVSKMTQNLASQAPILPAVVPGGKQQGKTKTPNMPGGGPLLNPDPAPFAELPGLGKSKVLERRNNEALLRNRREKLVWSKREFDAKLDVQPKVAPKSASAAPTDLRELDKLGQGLVWKGWTDERDVEQALRRANFATDFVIATERNREVLLYQGHLYDKYKYVPIEKNKKRQRKRKKENPDKVDDPNKDLLPTDSIINRWVCQNSYIQCGNCPAILVTTLNNDYLLLESVTGSHNHGVTNERRIHSLYWGADIMDVHRNHPDMTDREILDTLLLLYSDKNIKDSAGMVQHIHAIRPAPKKKTKRQKANDIDNAAAAFQMDVVEETAEDGEATANNSISDNSQQ